LIPPVVQLFQIGNTTPLFRNGRKLDAGLDLLSTITRRGTRSDWGADVCFYGPRLAVLPRPHGQR
jgi:hypothetical protein